MDCTCDFECEGEPIICNFCNSLVLIDLPDIIKPLSSNILNELLEICTELNLFAFQKVCIFDIWRKLNKNFKGRRRRIIFVVCIYYGLIICKTPRTIDELCQIYKITSKEFRMGIKIVGPFDVNIDISFYDRFIRLVELYKLPFNYAHKMDLLLKSSSRVLDLSLDKMINSIFIFIATENDIGEGFEYYCKQLKLSKYLYLNIKSRLIQ
ncbi:MAG: hypothetical protein N2B06_01815 [Clostridium sp.]